MAVGGTEVVGNCQFVNRSRRRPSCSRTRADGKLAHQLLPFEGAMRALLLPLLTGMALSALAELPPLTMKDVGLMLRTGYSSDSVLQEVQRRRVRGVLDEPAKQSLTEFGGSPELISALASGTFSLSESEAEEARRDANFRAQHQAQEAQRIYRSATEILKTQQQAQVSAPGLPLANSLAGKLVAFRNGTFEVADDSQFEKKKLIAFYFSAHWCAPCRRFTPQLVEYYNRVAPEHPEFEIVFVSSDRSRFNWETYIRDTRMPWLSITYDQVAAVPGLKKAAGDSIPSLILVDDTGRLLATSYEGESYAGPQKVLAELDKFFATSGAPGAASNR